MKGNIKITVEQTYEDCGFPITETYIIARDNTYESIEDWVRVFKKILNLVEFHPDTIKDVFNEE